MVKAIETNLEGVLEGKKQYQVPLFQRSYSWKREHVDRLWTDLVDIARVRRTSTTATHFIGSLVLATSPGVAAVGLQTFLVVDGQQRITTLTLLLAALRDHLVLTQGEEQRESIDTQYLINKFVKLQPTKFLPAQDDRATYDAIIRSIGHVGDDDKIGRTYHHLRSKIARLASEDDPVTAEELESAVLWGLALVAVTSEADDNAHRIFESLNNTGLQLTQSDLLKNYLFMRLGDRASAVYQAVWQPLEKKLRPENLELLFWLDLVLIDENAKQTDTYAGQQKRLDKFATSKQIEDEVNRIARLGDVLASILEPSRENDPEIRRCLERIKAWGSTTAYPVVMHILARRAAGSATAAQVVNALTCLVAYFVRRIVIGRATAGINRTLLQAVAAVADEADVDAALRSYLSSGRKHYATDKQVREAAVGGPFYHHGKKAQQNLILQWLEESYSGKERAELKSLSIEHVLAQNPSEGARDEFSETLPDDGDLASELERMVHTLGNLTLTGYNPELSNRPFSEKRAMLAKSPLRMNKAIADHDRWGTQQITARGEELAERIIQLWPGPDESVVETASALGLAARLAPVVETIPEGRWSSYTEVAVVVGSHPVAVGSVVANNPIHGAWRVLTFDGKPSPLFRWSDSARTDLPQEVLASEGIQFDEAGHASASQLLDARALADSAGIEIDDATITARRNKIWRKDNPSQLKQLRKEYWARFREWGEQNTQLRFTSAPSLQYWYDIGIGTAGTILSQTLTTYESRISTRLWIADNKPLYRHLFEHRDSIEAELGYTVEWEEMPEHKAAKVTISHEGDFRDPNQQLDLIAWHAKTADDFARVFRTYIRAVGAPAQLTLTDSDQP